MKGKKLQIMINLCKPLIGNNGSNGRFIDKYNILVPFKIF